MDLQVATVTHFYDKIGVAVIDVVNQELKVGDTVKISGHDREFTQEVTSLQVEHQQVKSVRPGQSAGMKVDQQVAKGDAVTLLTGA